MSMENMFIRNEELDLVSDLIESKRRALGIALSADDGVNDGFRYKITDSMTGVQRNVRFPRIEEVAKESTLSSKLKVGWHLSKINHNGIEYCVKERRTHDDYDLVKITGNSFTEFNTSELFKEGDSIDLLMIRSRKLTQQDLLESQMTGQPPVMFETSTVLNHKVSFLWNVEVKKENLSTVEKIILRNRVDSLNRIKNNLFNQDHVIESVLKKIKIDQVGIKEKNKPIGAYLFTGPTGVGKTEFAKLLAEELRVKLVRLDMSEYSAEHQISRLIGSPAGYIGYNNPTVLETQVGDTGEKMILLLDEMEKSHEEVQKIFLQVFDNANITLSNGKKIDFQNALIIMTSNIGVIQKNEIGMVGESKIQKVDMDKVRERFLPEFLGRISEIVEFNPLDKRVAGLIVNKFLRQFNERIKENKLSPNLRISLSDNLFNELSDKGFDPTYGARSIKNFFEGKILDFVADKILSNNVFEEITIDQDANGNLYLVQDALNLGEISSEN